MWNLKPKACVFFPVVVRSWRVPCRVLSMHLYAMLLMFPALTPQQDIRGMVTGHWYSIFSEQLWLLRPFAICPGEKGRAMGRGWSMATRTLEPSSAETGQAKRASKNRDHVAHVASKANWWFKHWILMISYWVWGCIPYFQTNYVCVYSHPKPGRWSLVVFMHCRCLSHVPVCLKRLWGWGDVRLDAAEYYRCCLICMALDQGPRSTVLNQDTNKKHVGMSWEFLLHLGKVPFGKNARAVPLKKWSLSPIQPFVSWA